MQYAFSTRLAALAVCLFISGKSMANDTTKMWSESDDYVKLEAVNATNQHPVTFSAEQLTNLLSRIYKRVDDKTPQAFFSEDEIERLSTDLLPVFAKSTAGDDVQFVTSYRPGGMFFIPRLLNAGRMFVEDGKFNVLVGMCGDSPDMAYYHATGMRRPINHASRIKPVSSMGCSLLSGNGALSVNNRPDWVQIDIAQALASKPEKSYQPIPGAGPATTFKPAEVPQTTFQPAPVATPAPVAAPAAPAVVTKPAPAAPQAVLPTAPMSKAEERLMLLKRLKDNGLINDAEYEQKRAAIVKEL